MEATRPRPSLSGDWFVAAALLAATLLVGVLVVRELRGALTSKLQYRLAAMVLRPGLVGLRDRMDPGTYGGAPLLGVNGFVLIAHGNSNAHSIKNALLRAHDAAQSGMIDSIRSALQRKS